MQGIRILNTFLLFFCLSLLVNCYFIVIKRGNEFPLSRKGNKSVLSNYRPISMTSVVGEMLESLTNRDISGHLENLI